MNKKTTTQTPQEGEKMDLNHEKIYYWSIGIWFLFALLGTINGIVREYAYKNLFGDLISHYISTIIFIILLFVIMYLFFNKSKFYYSNNGLWTIGISWLIATIFFEFFIGHYIFGTSWNILYSDYNIFNGRVWVLVLLSILVGPWLVGRKKILNKKK